MQHRARRRGFVGQRHDAAAFAAGVGEQRANHRALAEANDVAETAGERGFDDRPATVRRAVGAAHHHQHAAGAHRARQLGECGQHGMRRRWVERQYHVGFLPGGGGQASGNLAQQPGLHAAAVQRQLAPDAQRAQEAGAVQRGGMVGLAGIGRDRKRGKRVRRRRLAQHAHRLAQVGQIGADRGHSGEHASFYQKPPTGRYYAVYGNEIFGKAHGGRGRPGAEGFTA